MSALLDNIDLSELCTCCHILVTNGMFVPFSIALKKILIQVILGRSLVTPIGSVGHLD